MPDVVYMKELRTLLPPNLVESIRTYGEACRRAGAEAMREAAADLATEGLAGQYHFIPNMIRDLPLPSAAEAASPAAAWRPIFSAPYEDDVTVLLWTGIAELGARDGADWYDQSGSRIEGVTHWMPIDAPSEEARAG